MTHAVTTLLAGDRHARLEARRMLPEVGGHDLDEIVEELAMYPHLLEAAVSVHDLHRQVPLGSAAATYVFHRDDLSRYYTPVIEDGVVWCSWWICRGCPTTPRHEHRGSASFQRGVVVPRCVRVPQPRGDLVATGLALACAACESVTQWVAMVGVCPKSTFVA